MNAYECLGLEPHYAIDPKALERAYFDRQRNHHPDRAAVKCEKISSILSSMDLNDAYQTLKSPLKRAQHLLKLSGIEVLVDGKGVKPAPTLLMQVLEQREALDEAEDETVLKTIDQTAKQQREVCITRLNELFAAKKLDEAAQETLKLGYLEKLLDESRQKQRKLMAES